MWRTMQPHIAVIRNDYNNETKIISYILTKQKKLLTILSYLPDYLTLERLINIFITSIVIFIGMIFLIFYEALLQNNSDFL